MSGILIISLVAACGPQADFSTPDYFVAPSLVAQAATAELYTPTPAPPTPTPICENDLRFLEDITVPDNSDYQAGESIEKIWLVENNGSCNWNADYWLQKVGGDSLGVEPIQALFPARSGSQAELQISFLAPASLGRYQSSWQAVDPQGIPFGDLIFIQIDVVAAPSPTAEPQN